MLNKLFGSVKTWFGKYITKIFNCDEERIKELESTIAKQDALINNLYSQIRIRKVDKINLELEIRCLKKALAGLKVQFDKLEGK